MTHAEVLYWRGSDGREYSAAFVWLICDDCKAAGPKRAANIESDWDRASVRAESHGIGWVERIENGRYLRDRCPSCARHETPPQRRPIKEMT